MLLIESIRVLQVLGSQKGLPAREARRAPLNGASPLEYRHAYMVA